MKIKYFTHKPEEAKERHVRFGQCIVGVRLLELTLESNEELYELFTEKGSSWAKKHLRFKMTTPETTQSDDDNCRKHE